MSRIDLRNFVSHLLWSHLLWTVEMTSLLLAANDIGRLTNPGIAKAYRV